MESLCQKTENLVVILKENQMPAIRSLWITSYLVHEMRENRITLYEAYLLNAEALIFQRMAYSQPAWQTKVHISDLLKILNMKMLSILFQYDLGAEMWGEWGAEANLLNSKRRSHYIRDEYLSFLNLENNNFLLEKLLKVRKNKKKSFDEGPYHDEVFPYDYCVYEKLLLEGKKLPLDEKVINSDVENLLIELSLMQEES